MMKSATYRYSCFVMVSMLIMNACGQQDFLNIEDLEIPVPPKVGDFDDRYHNVSQIVIENGWGYEQY